MDTRVRDTVDSTLTRFDVEAVERLVYSIFPDGIDSRFSEIYAFAFVQGHFVDYFRVYFVVGEESKGSIEQIEFLDSSNVTIIRRIFSSFSVRNFDYLVVAFSSALARHAERIARTSDWEMKTIAIAITYRP